MEDFLKGLTVGILLALIAGYLYQLSHADHQQAILVDNIKTTPSDKNITEPVIQDDLVTENEDSPQASGNIIQNTGTVFADQGLLKKYYTEKLMNPAYVAWKNLPGFPRGYQDFKQEHLIKQVRSQLAKNTVLPVGNKVIHIPVTNSKLVIDGRLKSPEWVRATKIPIGIKGKHADLLLQSDGKYLYLACDALAEKTESGFDQFRFYYHLNVDDTIVNERIHVGRGRNGILGGIRQTTVRWPGSPPTSKGERWKKFPISDWRIYRNARGLSTFDKHRQYEVKLDLDEIGLHVGVPFAAFSEVETDPVKKDDGNFDHREYLGLLGSQGNPVWFVIDNQLVQGEHSTSPESSSTVYKWIDKQGNVQFSDSPPPKTN